MEVLILLVAVVTCSDPSQVTDELVELIYAPSCDPNAREVFVSVITGELFSKADQHLIPSELTSHFVAWLVGYLMPVPSSMLRPTWTQAF
jgi:hypothetical protein